jgi:uncharacterized membrane protein
MTKPLDRGARTLAGAFLVSGTLHVLRPRTFEPAIPPWLSPRREIVVWSGVAELACAVGLAVPATRRAAGLASAALLVAVFPGNVQMAADAVVAVHRERRRHGWPRWPRPSRGCRCRCR